MASLLNFNNCFPHFCYTVCSSCHPSVVTTALQIIGTIHFLLHSSNILSISRIVLNNFTALSHRHLYTDLGMSSGPTAFPLFVIFCSSSQSIQVLFQPHIQLTSFNHPVSLSSILCPDDTCRIPCWLFLSPLHLYFSHHLARLPLHPS